MSAFGYKFLWFSISFYLFLALILSQGGATYLLNDYNESITMTSEAETIQHTDATYGNGCNQTCRNACLPEFQGLSGGSGVGIFGWVPHIEWGDGVLISALGWSATTCNTSATDWINGSCQTCGLVMPEIEQLPHLDWATMPNLWSILINPFSTVFWLAWLSVAIFLVDLYILIYSVT